MAPTFPSNSPGRRHSGGTGLGGVGLGGDADQDLLRRAGRRTKINQDFRKFRSRHPTSPSYSLKSGALNGLTKVAVGPLLGRLLSFNPGAHFLLSLLPLPWGTPIPGYLGAPMWGYPWGAYGWTHCWGQQPNCGDAYSDCIDLNTVSSCLAQGTFECLSGQTYSSAQSANMRAGLNISVGATVGQIWIGFRHNLSVGRGRIHENWRRPLPASAQSVPATGIKRRGWHLPLEWEFLPPPAPERSYGPARAPHKERSRRPRVVPQTLTAAFGGRKPPESPTQSPPKPGTREAKFRVEYAKWKALADNFGWIGELGDFVAALYKALPWHLQNWTVDRTIDAKLRRIWKHLDQIDIPDAIWNVIQNEIEDRIIGKMGKSVAKGIRSSAKHGYYGRPVGLTSGPAL